MGVLYVVATPIGNLEDITLRALRVLREVGLIAAEDTRTTRKLLGHYGIETPMTSYHEHNRAAKIPQLVEALQTLDVALVSEAGTPAISDPGRGAGCVGHRGRDPSGARPRPVGGDFGAGRVGPAKPAVPIRGIPATAPGRAPAPPGVPQGPRCRPGSLRGPSQDP